MAFPTVGEIDVSNNVWSDPTGTMGSRFLNAYGDVDLASIRLRRNLFWNGGEPLPPGGDLPPTADVEHVEADPMLGAEQAGSGTPADGRWRAYAPYAFVMR